MLDPNKILDIPMEEKAFIDPTIRPKFFMDLIENYKVRYPNLKLIYAYLNTDSSVPIDYVVLFQTKNTDNTTDLTVFDIPLLYNDRSLPGYRYCKRLSLENDFFKDAIGNLVSLSTVRFYEFLNQILNLSIDPKHEMYWRKPELSKEVAKGLLDLALRHTKRIK